MNGLRKRGTVSRLPRFALLNARNRLVLPPIYASPGGLAGHDLLATPSEVGERVFCTMRLYAAFFSCDFTFAHLARCAAAILLRPAADIVCFPFGVRFFCFAQRACCAKLILRRAAADSVRRVPFALAPLYAPTKAESAAFNPVNSRSTRSRSFFICFTIPDTLAIGPFPLGSFDCGRIVTQCLAMAKGPPRRCGVFRLSVSI